MEDKQTRREKQLPERREQQEPSYGDDLDLTNMGTLRSLLYANNMRPNKSFGQNFLIDRTVLNNIVEGADIAPGDEVLEVGAGTGVLTRELAKSARRVVAVELERDMLAFLAKTTGHYSNVEIVERNLLYLDPTEVFGQAPYKLVANLPYYITAPTFRHFLESANPPQLMLVMVQQEVAERITAQPGDLSVLAISIQFYGTPRIVARVPTSAFYPAPKVDSAILRVDIRSEMLPGAPLTKAERDSFFRVVQAGFSEKRKQLHNSLTHGLHYKNEVIRNWLDEAGIVASRRAEMLSIEEWIRLWHVVQQGKSVLAEAAKTTQTTQTISEKQ